VKTALFTLFFEIMETNESRFKQNRAELIELSKVAKMAVKTGQFDSVNEALVSFYISPEHQTFKTFWEWKEEGYNIKKGAVSFKVWGTPKKSHRPQPAEGQDDEYQYWPICYLFSNAQVETARKMERATA
jgi:hypothetical protein